jgi:diketogulonate reductase-like aldo/keto reductase
MREFCRDRGIVYQAFSLLTANAAEVSVPAVQQISRRHNRTIPQIVFRFALESGMVALTGTTDPQHMRDDLAVFDFELDPAERETIEAVAVR